MNTMNQKKEIKEEIGSKFKHINLKIKGYDYGNLESKTLDEDYDDYEDEDIEYLSDITPQEGDKDQKKGKVLEILTSNTLLTRFPILLAQIKDGNNSYKLKNEIKQLLYFLYQHNKITKKVYNNLIKSL